MNTSVIGICAILVAHPLVCLVAVCEAFAGLPAALIIPPVTSTTSCSQAERMINWLASL